MPMKKTVPAANPDAYVESLGGWQRKLVEQLRVIVVKAAKLEEVVKWGHLVYFSNGPTLLIRAEDSRVLFGFWRGQRLRDIEPTLKASGNYEMATIELREAMSITDSVVRKLTRQAVALNKELGNPTDAAKPTKRAKVAKKAVKRRKHPAK
jgi:hypothetical protein